MTEESLRERLSRVRERLSAAALDRESHKLFAAVIRDIEIALGSGTAAAQAPRLESLAAKFEASHPQLAETMRELNDALVKAGI
ncbi:MAG: DUF4404 family protein [Steroidobacteraceae bacterium]